MTPLPLQTEAELWQLALVHFGSVGFVQILEQGAERFRLHRVGASDVFRPLPAKTFGKAIVALVRTTKIAQLEIRADHLLVPQALRRYLSAALLQALPVELLSSMLREQRLTLDLGI